MRLGENLKKKTSCESDKVRKLSRHKHIAKNLFVWNVLCFHPISIGFNQATLRILEQIKHDTRIVRKPFLFKQMGYYTGLWQTYI